VLILGVETENGIPRTPIEGFDIPTEELPLVIEQICLQGLNPPLIPTVTAVTSDVQGKVFYVIEVAESPQAPHAIENSTQVYVRTGNASNPYVLAKVDSIIDLVARRSAPQALRREKIQKQRERADSQIVIDTDMGLEIAIGPSMPRRPLLDREGLWRFINTETFRGGRFLPGQVVRRTNDGVAGLNGHEYGDLDQHGFIFWRNAIDLTGESGPGEGGNKREVRSLFYSLIKTTILAIRLYESLRYQGPIQIEVKLSNCFLQSMPFFPWQGYQLNDFRSVESTVTAQSDVSAENLRAARNDVLDSLISQVCWSFWQSEERFPQTSLSDYIARTRESLGER
jgi:hypothetical protein